MEITYRFRNMYDAIALLKKSYVLFHMLQSFLREILMQWLSAIQKKFTLVMAHQQQ